MVGQSKKRNVSKDKKPFVTLFFKGFLFVIMLLVLIHFTKVDWIHKLLIVILGSFITIFSTYYYLLERRTGIIVAAGDVGISPPQEAYYKGEKGYKPRMTLELFALIFGNLLMWLFIIFIFFLNY